MTLTVNVTTLDNGLRIITDNIPGVVTATVGMWVNVGARHEPSEINGISHFLEHMAFKGTTSRTAFQIAEAIENVGGHLNAYTSREKTAYHARLLAADLPLAIELLADILQNSIFDPKEIERERDVILQEIGQSYDTPDDIIFDHFQKTAFSGQSLGRPILGTAEIISKINQDILREYMKQQYTVDRMVFAATGGIEHDQVVKLAREKFSSLSKGSPPSLEKAQYTGGHFFENKKLEQTHILIGFESLPYGHKDYYTLAVLSGLLGGGMSSRLFQEVREKRGLVYSIYSFNTAFQDTGLFGIYAGTGPNQVGELIPVVQDILNSFSTSLSSEEILRSKAQLKAGLMMGLESTSARCEQLAQHMLIYGHSIPSQEIINKIDEVEKEDISRVAEKLFQSLPSFATISPGKIIHWKTH